MWILVEIGKCGFDKIGKIGKIGKMGNLGGLGKIGNLGNWHDSCSMILFNQYLNVFNVIYAKTAAIELHQNRIQ